MRRVSVQSWVFLLVLIAVGAGAVTALNRFATASPEGSEAVPSGEPVEFTVPKGAGVGRIGDLLAEASVIESGQAFRAVAQVTEDTRSIQPGTYELETAMGADAAFSALLAGPDEAAGFAVTIQEGLPLSAITETIADAEDSSVTESDVENALAEVEPPEMVPVDELPEDAKPLEGTLFPSTYEFNSDATATDVVTRMRDEMTERLTAIDVPSGLSTYEIVTIASMIEREVSVPEERSLVSSVIRNRLESNMVPAIDATTRYAVGKLTSNEPLTRADRNTASPWNTYETTELPPTPIAAPGADALRAAANPAATDYLFYVRCSAESGRQIFEETGQAHDRNVNRWEEIQAEGSGSFCPSQPASGSATDAAG